MKAKAQWEATLAKLENIQNETHELIRAREAVYDKLVGTSLGALSSGAVSDAAGRYVCSECCSLSVCPSPYPFV